MAAVRPSLLNYLTTYIVTATEMLVSYKLPINDCNFSCCPQTVQVVMLNFSILWTHLLQFLFVKIFHLLSQQQLNYKLLFTFYNLELHLL